MIDLALIQLLTSDARITVMVADRISQSYVPQAQDPPMIVCLTQEINKGLTKDEDQNEELSVDIVSISSTLSECKEIDLAVFQLMHHYAGPRNVTLSAGHTVKIRHSYLASTQQQYNGEIKYHTIISNYQIKGTVTVATSA